MRRSWQAWNSASRSQSALQAASPASMRTMVSGTPRRMVLPNSGPCAQAGLPISSTKRSH